MRQNPRRECWPALAALVAFVPTALTAQESDRQQVTFAETIAPILYENCVMCHRSGEIAPFSLVTYDDVVARGARIAEATASRRMPPWQPAHGYGEFVGERRLSEEQIALIGSWVQQGMPAGDLARAPEPPEPAEGWQLGEPDLVLEMPTAFELSSRGHDVYRNFVLPTGLAEDKWVRAVELRSNAPTAAHHALFAYVESGAFAHRDGEDGQPGFGGSMAAGFVPGQAAAGSLGGWAVGGQGMMFPEGMWPTLPAGSDFLLQMHYHLMGGPAEERAQVGLYFADEPPNKLGASLDLPPLFGFGAGIDIPAGEPNHVVRDAFTLPADILVHGAWGHAHRLGVELSVDATLPDGAAMRLFWIPDWNFNWQEIYLYKQPIALPKGARVEGVIRYDNSSANPRNPFDPPQRVLWGLESDDEMGTVGLMIEIVSPQDESTMRQALADRTRGAIQRGVEDGTLQRYLAQQADVNAGDR